MKIAISLTLFSLVLASCKAAPDRPGSFGSSRDGENSTGEPGSDPDPDPDPIGGENDPTGGGETPVGPNGEELNITFNTALPRLTHYEWENSVRDIFLFSGKPNLASKFSSDDNSTIFHNDSARNIVSSNLSRDYQEAAEEIGKRISQDANLVKKLTEGAPAGDNAERAKAVLKNIIQRAFRRPATTAELDGLAKIYVEGRKLTGGTNFDASGLRATAAAILQSPQFIYHYEFGTKEGKLAKLDPYEVAARLSYAVLKSIPDEELFDAAADGKLGTEEEIKAQVQRLFKDPRSTDTLRYFINELFETKKYVDLTKNQMLYPKFPNDLGDTLKKEAEMFIDDVIVKNNGGITKLLTETYTFANDKTAPLYDIPAPGSKDLVKVELDPKKRAGIITQIGWLAAKATSERTSTIQRGFYVMNRLACDTLPPQVGSEMKGGEEFKTRREEVLAKTGTCGGTCHANFINPPAFALEAFDASGVWRDKENGNPIDTTGIYGAKSGKDPQTSFKDAVGLMQGITKRITTHECFVSRTIEVLYNRRTNDLDKAAIARLGKESLKGMGARDIMIELLSDPLLIAQRPDNE